MTSQSTLKSTDTESFDAIEAYDWESDREFQTGLRSILSSVPAPTAEQKEELTQRAKCFFYSKMSGIKTDYNLYKVHISQGKPDLDADVHPPELVQREYSRTLDNPVQEPALDTICPNVSGDRYPLSNPTATAGSTSTASGGTLDAPCPDSFARIVELITTGQLIPGIKQIPNELNSAPPSEPVRAKRLKPWEKSTDSTGAGCCR